MKEKYDELENVLKTMEGKLSASSNEACEYLAQNMNLINVNSNLNEKLDVLLSMNAELKDEVDRNTEAIDSLASEKKLAQTLAAQMSQAEDVALSELQGVEVHLSSSNLEIIELRDESARFNILKEGMDSELLGMKAENCCLREQLSKVESNLAQSNSVAESEKALRVSAESKAMSNLARYEELSKVKNSIEEDLLKTVTRIEEEKANNSILCGKLNRISSVLAKLNEVISNNDCIAKTLLSDIEFLDSFEKDESVSVKMVLLVEQLRFLMSRVSDLQTNNEDMLQSKEEMDDFNQKLIEMKQEKEAVETSWRNECELTNSLQTQVETLRLEAEKNQTILNDTSSEVVQQKHNLEAKLKATQEETTKQCAREEELLLEVEKLKQDIELYSSQLSELSMNHSIDKQNLIDTNRELQLSQKKIDSLQLDMAKKSGDNDENEQIVELQQLLASANAREEEAKNIALATDEELERKEREVEEIHLFATECEAAAKEWENKCRDIDARESSPSNHDAEEILKEMELLMEEKMDVENELDAVKADRDAMEQSLRTKFGEEQRELLQEAEAMMNELRDSLSKKEDELDKYRKDARTTREELVAVQERLKSDLSSSVDADGKIKLLTERLTSAENQSSQLKSDLQSLQDEYASFKDHSKLSKESLKESSETKLAAVRHELGSLREKLHQETYRAHSFEEQSNFYEKEIPRLQEEMSAAKQSLLREKDFAVSKLKEEIATTKVELSRSQADIFSLNQKLQGYKELAKNLKHRTRRDAQNEEEILKYEKLLNESRETIKYKTEELRQSATDLILCKEELLNFQESSKDFKKKMRAKDERITSLESKRMTKEHISMIKRLKVSPNCVSFMMQNLSH